jgi:DNA mismatch repair protein MLH3
MLATLERRISKASLQEAEVVAQVDRKFILAKVATNSSLTSTSRVSEADRMLILIDQHAADERCKVENLLQTYFIPDPAGSDQLVAQTRSLDKPLRFDLSRQDRELLSRFKRHFAHWGIAYEVLPEAPSRKGVTVEAQSLPPSILERCRLEPRLLIDLLRKEIWKLHSKGSNGRTKPFCIGRHEDWVARFHDCPDGILDLINSRACRSKCTMVWSNEQQLTVTRRNHVQRPPDHRGVLGACPAAGSVCLSVSVCSWAAFDGPAGASRGGEHSWVGEDRKGRGGSLVGGVEDVEAPLGK